MALSCSSWILFVCISDIPAESWNTIASEGKAVIEDVVFPALLRLHAFLKTEYLPRTRSTPGVAGLKDGSAFYSACLKWHLMISMGSQRSARDRLARSRTDPGPDEIRHEGSRLRWQTLTVYAGRSSKLNVWIEYWLYNIVFMPIPSSIFLAQ